MFLALVSYLNCVVLCGAAVHPVCAESFPAGHEVRRAAHVFLSLQMLHASFSQCVWLGLSCPFSVWPVTRSPQFYERQLWRREGVWWCPRKCRAHFWKLTGENLRRMLVGREQVCPPHSVLPSPSNHCFLYLSSLFNIITIIIVCINNVFWSLLSLFKRQCLQLSQCVIVLFSQRTAVFRVTLEIAILKSYQCFICKKTKVPARSMFHEMHHSLNENLGYY